MTTHNVLKQDGETVLFNGTEADCLAFVARHQAKGIWEIVPTLAHADRLDEWREDAKREAQEERRIDAESYRKGGFGL